MHERRTHADALMGWQDANGPKARRLAITYRCAGDDHVADHAPFALGDEGKRRHPRRTGAQSADESDLNGLNAETRVRREGAAMDLVGGFKVSVILPADEHGHIFARHAAHSSRPLPPADVRSGPAEDRSAS
ncbi:MAG TPA: hypothetical protein VM287_14710 [Egibacteraceae bacterium]|nr:hypothetical protein [Egibacteraceae bacterium]